MRHYPRTGRRRPVSHPRCRLDSTHPRGHTSLVMHRDPKRLAAAIVARRAQLGITQAELAERADLGLATVQRAEKGDRAPRAMNLSKFDRGLDWPEGRASAVLDGLHRADAATTVELDADPELLSPDWWLTLRRALTAKMFAEVSDLVHLGRKAAAERDQPADRA